VVRQPTTRRDTRNFSGEGDPTGTRWGESEAYFKAELNEGMWAGWKKKETTSSSVLEKLGYIGKIPTQKQERTT